MEDQYGLMPPDLRRYVATGPDFYPPPPLQPPPASAELHSGRLGLTQTHPYDVLAFRPVEGGSSGGGGGGGSGRWQRQETLTLLEIRSRLDFKFKEVNHKGPLWDEVSRIMSEEHGYHRSGKKCREKFENIYKYYKKTKDGKTGGRQDRKHYRFFSQLEALYGQNNINNSSASNSEALHSQPFDNFPSNEPDTTTASTDDTEGFENRKMGWKEKIEEFVDLRMKDLMEKQDAWMEKMMEKVERKEKERLMREEEWRRQDAARIEREHRFWAGERAWVEARDTALMEALNKLGGKDFVAQQGNNNGCNNGSANNNESGVGVNGVSESCLRYFMGDGYGGVME
ncbi:homeodomain-like superfamily protein [Striga asiatica]|uniref:Homeodomain-like superfamily protein n=1 Tax=Striga asiatica TaxID=4170 RepID=A0A5A7R9Y3_STRAF|nr:homeodomain-like superfamily protein [Striga asiatica]